MNFLDGLEQYGFVGMVDWRVEINGVFREKARKDGSTYYEFASHTPILPIEILTNIGTSTEKVRLAYWSAKRWRDVVVDRSTISSRNSIVRLSDYGIDVTSETAKNLVAYLADAIATTGDAMPRSNSTTHMGWDSEGQFIPYTSEVSFDGDMTYKSLFDAVVDKKGDRDEWIAMTEQLRKRRFLRLMMDVSFASPLIGLVNENPFILMMWGGTGAGKTVGSMVAMSIWGNPDKGKLLRTMNMTANAMMHLSAFLNNLPFAGDELQTIKTYWANYDQLVMKVTEGIDRGRLGDGGKTMQEAKSWNCAYIFTGEEPITKAESGGGVKNRVIEIECTEKVVENGNEVVNFVKRNYGLVAREYIEAVKRTDVRGIYNEFYRGIMETESTTDKQAGSMALILTADRIVHDLFYPREDPLIYSNTYDIVKSADEVDVAVRAWDYICSAIAENSNAFQSDCMGKIMGEIDDTDRDWVYVNANSMKELMSKEGFDISAVKRKWEQMGVLDKGKTGYTAVKRINGICSRCYRLKAGGSVGE